MVDPWTMRELGAPTFLTGKIPCRTYSWPARICSFSHPRFCICGFNQPWIMSYCCIYFWKSKWTCAVQTSVVQGPTILSFFFLICFHFHYYFIETQLTFVYWSLHPVTLRRSFYFIFLNLFYCCAGSSLSLCGLSQLLQMEATLPCSEQALSWWPLQSTRFWGQTGFSSCRAWA